MCEYGDIKSITEIVAKSIEDKKYLEEITNGGVNYVKQFSCEKIMSTMSKIITATQSSISPLLFNLSAFINHQINF